MISKETQRAEIVRRYLTELGTPDSYPGLLDELLAADAVIHGPGIELSGIETIRSFMRSLSNVSRFHTTVRDLFGAGGRVAVRLSHEVTCWLDEDRGLSAPTRTITWDAIAIVRFEGAKIAEEWIHREPVPAFFQFAALLAPDQTAMDRSVSPAAFGNAYPPIMQLRTTHWMIRRTG